MQDTRPGRPRVRIALVSGAAIMSLTLATALVLWLGSVLPLFFVDQNIDDYRGAKEMDVLGVIGEMYESRQDGLGTYRVTAWEVTSVEKCRTRRPRPYAVRLELYTLFGVPYGETGLPCGPPGSAGGSRS